jgi:hypothetical protein
MREWLGADLLYRAQSSGDLGHRMAHAFQEAFQAGMDRVVVIGSDCPGITDTILLRAFRALTHTDVVLGPALDGGYYLIGLRRFISRLFVDIPWGTETVLAQTRQVVRDLGFSLELLEYLGDVDRPEDLSIWEKESKYGLKPSQARHISIIIPTLNEEGSIDGTLASIRDATDVDVTVVDGGSRDRTTEIASSWGAKVIICPLGRARQVNTGAAQAKGEILLFLHADTHLPNGFDRYVRQILAQRGTVAGAFKLRIDARAPGLHFVEHAANWRSGLFQFPYGDQAIFLNADLFRRVGGFPDMPIMEDFELVRRLRRMGRVATAPVPVVTSARRWEVLGIWRTTAINYAIPIAYALGISPDKLAQWYHRKQRRPRAESPSRF